MGGSSVGYTLFTHSVRMVFSQFRDALRISGPLYIVSFLLQLAFLSDAMAGRPESSPSGAAILATLAEIVVFFWIAVAWHRFILLDESPGSVLPRFHGRPMLRYLGCCLLLLLVMALPLALAFVVGAFAAAALGMAPVLIAILGVVAFVPVVAIGYRLATILPGAAIDRPVPLHQAWDATRGATGSILMLALISTIASFLIQAPVAVLHALPFGLVPALIWSAIAGWVSTMVGVSILTTLYGYYVEGRVID